MYRVWVSRIYVKLNKRPRFVLRGSRSFARSRLRIGSLGPAALDVDVAAVAVAQARDVDIAHRVGNRGFLREGEHEAALGELPSAGNGGIAGTGRTFLEDIPVKDQGAVGAKGPVHRHAGTLVGTAPRAMQDARAGGHLSLIHI